MFVCSCFAVSDSTIEAAIEDGAATIAAVTRSCRAGGDCGACHAMIEDLIEAAAESSCSRSKRIHLPRIGMRAA
jgi:bacterioferritin-associated ferredoxin